MISRVVPYLFETAKRRKIGYRVCENDSALEGETCRETGHVLLSDARVKELPRMMARESVQHAEPQVARNQEDLWIQTGKPIEPFDKRVSHLFEQLAFSRSQLVTFSSPVVPEH